MKTFRKGLTTVRLVPKETQALTPYKTDPTAYELCKREGKSYPKTVFTVMGAILLFVYAATHTVDVLGLEPGKSALDWVITYGGLTAACVWFGKWLANHG